LIFLFYNSPWSVGGSTTFTVHLKKVLGNDARIIKLGKRTESHKRPLGDYGVKYHIMSAEDIKRLDGPILLTASHPKIDCYLPGMYCVFHDPNEFRIYPHWKSADKTRVICIRKTGLTYFPKATFIPHPYVRSFENIDHVRKHHAVSTARFSAVKNSDMILEANTQLPTSKQVKCLGEPNRMWIHYTILKRFPDFKTHTSFPKVFNQGAVECSRAHWNVDLSIFKGDGGGTQYTLLEAMDAGCVPIMHEEWTNWDGPAIDFGPSVANVKGLATVLKAAPSKSQIERNWEYLEDFHDPKTIAEQYIQVMG